LNNEKRYILDRADKSTSFMTDDASINLSDSILRLISLEQPLPPFVSNLLLSFGSEKVENRLFEMVLGESSVGKLTVAFVGNEDDLPSEFFLRAVVLYALLGRLLYVFKLRGIFGEDGSLIEFRYDVLQKIIDSFFDGPDSIVMLQNAMESEGLNIDDRSAHYTLSKMIFELYLKCSVKIDVDSGIVIKASGTSTVTVGLLRNSDNSFSDFAQYIEYLYTVERNGILKIRSFNYLWSGLLGLSRSQTFVKQLPTNEQLYCFCLALAFDEDVLLRLKRLRDIEAYRRIANGDTGDYNPDSARNFSRNDRDRYITRLLQLNRIYLKELLNQENIPREKIPAMLLEYAQQKLADNGFARIVRSKH